MENGYHLYPDVLSGNECDRLLAALRVENPASGRAGTRHMMRNPSVAALAHAEPLRKIAAGVLSGTAVPYRATLFEKSPAANWLVAWHQDTALPLVSRFEGSPATPATQGWGSWSVKEGIDYAHAPSWALSRIVALRVHLDDSTSDNGPLRAIPGSHTLGVLSDQAAVEYACANPMDECIVARGGVLAMRPLLIHASSKSRNSAPRRVLHIEYADTLDLAPGIRLAIA